MGHIKTTEEGEKKKLYYSRQCQLVWHAAVSPIHLPVKKKPISWRLIEYHITVKPRSRLPLSHMEPECTEVLQTWIRSQKKSLDRQHSAFINSHLETKAHVLSSLPRFSLAVPSYSSHLLWSKAFPVHLLSPVRRLSNNSCYLVVNRWESELNLFRQSPGFCSQQNAVLALCPEILPGRHMWNKIVSLNFEKKKKSTWFHLKEKRYPFICYSRANLWSDTKLLSWNLRVLNSVSGQ